MSDPLQPTRLTETVACPRCDQINAGTSNFCIECGANLKEAKSSEPKSGAGETQPEGAGPGGASREATPSAGRAPEPESSSTRPDTGEAAREGATAEAAREPSRGDGAEAGEAGEVPRRRGTRPLALTPDLERVWVTHLDASDVRSRHAVRDRFVIGREEGDLRVPGDPYLSGRHASIRREGSAYLLQDLDSTNGTYIRIRDRVRLESGDWLMAGEQIFRFERLEGSGAEEEAGPRTRLLGGAGPAVGRLVRLGEGGRELAVHPLRPGRTVIGRARGDLRFPDDELLSGEHASISAPADPSAGEPFLLKDEGSRNGVFLRLRSEWPLQVGDLFVAGRQVFRLEEQPVGEGVSSAQQSVDES